MARGQRKPIEEKIREKEEIVAELEAKLKKEKDELKALNQQKKEQDVNALLEIMKDSKMSVDELKEMALKNKAE